MDFKLEKTSQNLILIRQEKYLGSAKKVFFQIFRNNVKA